MSINPLQNPRTFQQIYEDPPTGPLILREEGSSTTAAMAPSNAPSERQLPRHIIKDPDMCQYLMDSARHYLANAGTASVFLEYMRMGLTEKLSHAGVGDETRNLDLFSNVATYIIQFVTAADQISPDDLDLAPCENQGGIRSNRKFRRGGVNRITIEHKSYGASQQHFSEIHHLGHGQGAEIIFEAIARDAQSIIHKVRIFSTSCS